MKKVKLVVYAFILLLLMGVSVQAAEPANTIRVEKARYERPTTSTGDPALPVNIELSCYTIDASPYKELVYGRIKSEAASARYWFKGDRWRNSDAETTYNNYQPYVENPAQYSAFVLKLRGSDGEDFTSSGNRGEFSVLSFEVPGLKMDSKVIACGWSKLAPNERFYFYKTKIKEQGILELSSVHTFDYIFIAFGDAQVTGNNSGSSSGSASGGNSNSTSNSGTSAAALGTVKNLTAAQTKYNTIILNWSPVAGAKNYEILYSTTPENANSFKRLAVSKKTSYKFTKAKCGVEYTFKVRACGKSGKTKTYGAYTQTSGKTTLGGACSLDVKKTTYNSVTLKWSKVAGAKKYRIFTSSDGQNWKLLTTKGGTSYTCKGLPTGKSAYYKVIPERDSFVGNESNQIVATTVLDTVKNLKARASGADSMKLSWKKVPGVLYYEVYRLDRKSGEYVLLENAKRVSKNSYIDTGLYPSTQYSYKVIGVTAQGVRTGTLAQIQSAAGVTKPPKK